MSNNRFLLSDNWANDIDLNGAGDIWDVDVINQSIELILTTLYGERIFNLSFGCGLTLRVFETMTSTAAESILDEVASSIKRWENRVTVVESQMRLIKNQNDNSIIIIIPYIINKTGISSIFKKKLVNF